MKNAELINKFVNTAFGFEGQGSHLFSEKVGAGVFIYSYGRHFPLALRIGNTFIVNTDKYSKTTSKHQTILRGALSRPDYYKSVAIKEINTKGLKDLESKFSNGEIATRDDLILREI